MKAAALIPFATVALLAIIGMAAILTPSFQSAYPTAPGALPCRRKLQRNDGVKGRRNGGWGWRDGGTLNPLIQNAINPIFPFANIARLIYTNPITPSESDPTQSAPIQSRPTGLALWT